MKEIKHLSVHQWIRSAIPDSQQPTSPIGFLFLKLPPPPCAVLLVNNSYTMLSHSYFLTELATGSYRVCWGRQGFAPVVFPSIDGAEALPCCQGCQVSLNKVRKCQQQCKASNVD